MPRAKKDKSAQSKRTKSRAEVFTPVSICKEQNDLIDKSIAGDKATWQDYVNATFLEITCGEAPYLVSRYDAVTGEPIEIANRVGLLDRKLKLINANVNDKSDWQNWTKCAVKSTYGYEFQGDNLFLARCNVLMSVEDYYVDKFNENAPLDFLIETAQIIAWNLWQMDGLNYRVPATKKFAQVKDWSDNKIELFKDLMFGNSQTLNF